MQSQHCVSKGAHGLVAQQKLYGHSLPGNLLVLFTLAACLGWLSCSVQQGSGSTHQPSSNQGSPSQRLVNARQAGRLEKVSAAGQPHA